MSDKFLSLVAISIILMMVFGTALQMRKPQHASPLLMETVAKARVARALPAIDSTDTDGASMPFNARITRPTVINFWASWCIPCVREIPTLAVFKGMAEGAGIDFLTVAEDKEGAGPALKLLQDKGITGFKVVVDADGAIAKASAVKGMPTTLIVDAKGNEVGRIEGEADWSQPVSLETVKALLEMGAPGN